MTETLSYAAFVEALGRIALIALDKPTFEALYPTAVDKVTCRWMGGVYPRSLCSIGGVSLDAWTRG